MNKVKRSDEFKIKLAGAREETQKNITEKTERLVNIHKTSDIIISMKYLKQTYDNLKPGKYIKQLFDKSPRFKEEIEMQLIFEAKQKIKSWKFWILKKSRKEYVGNNIENTYAQEYDKWVKEKESFDNAELQTEILENEKYLKEYQTEKENLEKCISGDDNYIRINLEKSFMETEFPLPIKINSEIKNSAINIDLELPKIEDYPDTKASILSTGKLSVKKKSKTELYQDYLKAYLALRFILGEWHLTSLPQSNIFIYSVLRNG